MNDMVLPYKIMALAPFAPVPEEKFKPEFVMLDLYSLDDAVAALSPVLYLPVSEKLCSEGAVTLKFKKIKDFKPDNIINNTPVLQKIAKQQTQPHRAGRGASSPKKQDAVEDILSMVDTDASLPPAQAKRVHAVSGQDDLVNEIFNNKEFKKTESAWRGLQTLVKKAQIKGFKQICITICPVSHDALENILNEIALLPVDRTPNLVLVDLDLDNTMPCIDLLEKITAFADKMLIPVCTALNPEFLRIHTWDEMDKLSYIKNHMDDISYAKFRKLKTSPGSQWTVAACNRFAARDMYEFEPDVPWASPVWCLGTLCAKAFQKTGWPMDFSKYTEYYLDDMAVAVNKKQKAAATQGLFPDDRILQLVEAGITPLAGTANKDTVFIPKEASLAGESIKFSMFFNRIIEALIHVKENASPETDPENLIKQGLNTIFIQTGYPAPQALSITEQSMDTKGRKVLKISFMPPVACISVSEKLEFSFMW